MATKILNCPCAPYFTQIDQISFSQNILQFNSDEGGTSYFYFSERPFLPVAILKNDGSGQIDFTNSKNFSGVFRAILNAVLASENNFVNDIAGNDVVDYNNNNYGVYLPKNIGVSNSTLRINRYLQPSSSIKDFWDNVSLADLQVALKDFYQMNKDVFAVSDKRYFCPPIGYQTKTGSALKTILDAIISANPTWLDVKFLTIELLSIG